MSNYSRVFNDYLAQVEEQGGVVVKVEDIVKEMLEDKGCMKEVQKMSKHELIKRYFYAITSVNLNSCGYRSVIKGKGYYADLERCKDPECLGRLLNNANLSAQEKARVKDLIQERIKREEQISGQMEFDISGIYYPHLSDEELLERLAAEAI